LLCPGNQVAFTSHGGNKSDEPASQNAKTAIATGKGKPELFVEHAQILIGEMAILSEKSSMLESPTIDVDFNKVQYEEQGVKKDLLI
jgi:hypothetical protein